MINELMDLVFPRSCAGCGAWDTCLCEACARDLAGAWLDVSWRAPYLLHPRSSRHGLALPGDFEPIFPVLALGEYEGVRRRAIITWKNVVSKELTRVVSRIVAIRAAELARAVHARGDILVIPAPSRWRRRHDGRFVVGRMARAVAEGFAAAGARAGVVDVLRSGRASGSGLRGRRRKPSEIRARQGFRGKPNCIVVDDVLASGATLAGCARALERTGAAVIGAVVLAAAKDPRDRKVGVT